MIHNRPPFINHAQLTSQLHQSHKHTRPIDPPRELHAEGNRPIIYWHHISISMHTLVHTIEMTNTASQPFNQHSQTHIYIHTYRYSYADIPLTWVWPESVCRHWPETQSHTFRVLSADPLTTRPSLIATTAYTYCHHTYICSFIHSHD